MNASRYEWWSLPQFVTNQSVALDELGSFVGRVTDEEQVIPGSDFPREPHEQQRVEGERRRHFPGNVFRVFLEVGDGR